MRTFVAVEIDNKEILRKIRSMQESAHFKAKPVRLDQIHFTLQFLGEIPDEKIDQVKDVLMTLNFTKFDLDVLSCGAFPNSRNPRVIWLGVDNDGGRKISNWSKDVSLALTRIGLKNDKPFKPHLTIFRVKTRIDDITNELLKFKKVEFGKQMVSKIVLKKSKLTQNGPEYTNLGEISGK